MPIIQVNILSGRSTEQKAEFASRVTQLAAEVLQVKPEAVRVLIQEYAAGEWYTAGKAVAPPKSSP